MLRPLLLLLLLPALLPASAGAATAGADDLDGVVVHAARGEANRLLIRVDAAAGTAVLTDGGAPLRARPGCTRVDDHTVTCTLFDEAGGVVDLGDGDDAFTAAGDPLGLIVMGGDGDDALAAGPGGAELRGEGGDDRLAGGAGDDLLVPGAGRDGLACGDGADEVREPGTRDLVPADCERVSKGEDEEDRYAAAAHPASVRGGVARWAIACATTAAGDPDACRGTVLVREQGGRRRQLGRGTVTGTERRARPVTAVVLTPLGRRLVRRGVRATVLVRGQAAAPLHWALLLSRG